MSGISPDQFSVYFSALHGYASFAWQTELARRVCDGDWPAALALPTAAGKTACIDIALFAAACQATAPADRRTAPRRIFFVVDRRVIVDEAYERTRRIAEKLAAARAGVLAAVAAALRGLAGNSPGESDNAAPLDCFQLRGGVYRDDAWARTPTRPTVICSTVDQLGSRLLFRSYGCSSRTWPRHAGLACHDSLILLDEAHCAVPFMQTLQAVRRYRTWSQRSLPSPFQAVVMTATPPAEVTDVFPSPQEAEALLLSDMALKNRIIASKPAELVEAARPKKPRKGEIGLSSPISEDPLVLDAADRALKLAADGRHRIAIMVNRVATAKAIHAEIENELSGHQPIADTVLLTGRMRPLDRDALLVRWKPRLRAFQPEPVDRPAIVVTTQCLEVGADFSFDALITECASLDALRQRFGRLNRLGTCPQTSAVILIRQEQAKSTDDDPVYGPALAATWAWLRGAASGGTIDMGIAGFDRLLPASSTDRHELLATLGAPAANAPIMLPAHLDCWAQTSPEPVPSPDVSLFLRGPRHGAPEALVCWRADLDPGHPNEKTWIDTVALCTPTSIECLSVPLHVLRAWWRNPERADRSLTDIDGGASPTEDDRSPQHAREAAALRWLGPDDPATCIVTQPEDIRPGDLLVLPAQLGGWNTLGYVPDVPEPHACPPSDRYAWVRVDIGDIAHRVMRAQPILRVHPEWIASLSSTTAASQLRRLLDAPDPFEWEDWREALESLTEDDVPDGTLLEAFRTLLSDPRAKLVPYPRGVVLCGRRQKQAAPQTDGYSAEDDSSSTTVPVTLDDHLAHVRDRAHHFASACGLSPQLVDDLMLAASLHDVGKADPRFQALLCGGNLTRAQFLDTPLAKSDARPGTRREAFLARRRAGLPNGFRHELLAVRLVESTADVLIKAHDQDLVLHLIAAHHGRCRPFAPVVEDPAAAGDPPWTVACSVNGRRLSYRFDGSTVSGHGLERLDSGVAERFWRLLRRYGWWGLAYLESLVILADHRASEDEEQGTVSGGPTAVARAQTNLEVSA